MEGRHGTLEGIFGRLLTANAGSGNGSHTLIMVLVRYDRDHVDKGIFPSLRILLRGRRLAEEGRNWVGVFDFGDVEAVPDLEAEQSGIH